MQFFIARLSLLLMMLCGLFFAGCGASSDQRAVIEQFIASVERDRTGVLSNFKGIYADYRAYQQPDEAAVVVETIYTAGMPTTTGDSSKLKSELIEEYSRKSDMRAVLDAGVDIISRYKKPDGSIHEEARITAADLPAVSLAP